VQQDNALNPAIPVLTPRFHFVALILSFAAMTNAYSLPTDSPSVARQIIQHVDVKGLWQTSKAYFFEVAQIEPGAAVNQSVIDEAKERLMKTNLFDSVSPELADAPDGTTLIFSVKEKLNLSVLPYDIRLSNSFYGGGLTFVDTNFLGSAKIFSIGQALSNNGPNGSIGYEDPFLLDRKAGFRAALEGGITDRTEQDSENRTLDHFSYWYYTARVVLKYQPDQGTGVTLELQQQNFQQTEGNGTVANRAVFTPAVSVVFDQQVSRAYLRAGQWFGARYAHGFAEVGLDSYDAFQARWDSTFEEIGDTFIDIGAAGQWGNQNLLLVKPLTGKGFRTLSGKSYSNKNIGTFAEWDVPVHHFDWGAIGVGGFYELGWYSTDTTVAQINSIFYGPGLGAYVYLRNSPLPAFHADFAYNQVARVWNFSLVLGPSLDSP
jgi:hypothetical protein